MPCRFRFGWQRLFGEGPLRIGPRRVVWMVVELLLGVETRGEGVMERNCNC